MFLLRRFTSSSRALAARSEMGFGGKDSLYETLSRKLESEGNTNVIAHVTSQQTKNVAAVGRCPWLASDPVLQRISQRESSARTYNRRFPVDIVSAKGSWLTDAEGRKWLDSLMCAGTLALGHNHEVVKKAMAEFIESDQPLQTLDLISPTKDRFVSKVFEALPKAFSEQAKVQFCGPSGTDCVEAAVKLAKRATGRSNVAAFMGGYHGHTIGALALMGNLDAKQQQPNLMPGAHFFPFPYDYRCPMGMGGDEGALACADYIERTLDDPESGISKPAAFIIEAVQGEGGVIPANPLFLQRLRQITEERGILLICDEIQCGWARTGHMFGFEAAGIIPDVVCLSKAVGGSLPMALVCYRGEFDQWGPGEHAGTFRGNQMAMATGAATIDYMLENRLQDRAAEMGDRLHQRLLALQQKHPERIGQVRGLGLMRGLEVVGPANSANPNVKNAPPLGDGDLAARIQNEAFRRGLLIERGGRHGAVVRFLPALTIEDHELDLLVDIFEEAFEASL